MHIHKILTRYYDGCIVETPNGRNTRVGINTRDILKHSLEVRINSTSWDDETVMECFSDKEMKKSFLGIRGDSERRIRGACTCKCIEAWNSVINSECSAKFWLRQKGWQKTKPEKFARGYQGGRITAMSPHFYSYSITCSP